MTVPPPAERASRHAAAALIALLGVLTAARPARGDPEGNCPAADAWAAACAKEHGIAIVAETCQEERAVVRIAAPGADPLRVEVTPGRGAAFRRAGAVGLSPIVVVDDWGRQVPEPTRRAFDALAACAERGVPEAVFAPRRAIDRVQGRRAAAPGSSLWRLLGAVVLSAVCLALSTRRAPPAARRRRAWAALSLLGLAAATFLFRRLAVAPAFFHQNGQGPVWVDFYASGGQSEYGPGFFDLFGVFAQRWPGGVYDGVFTGQSILAAASAPLAWVIARCLGARPALAWAVAVLVAVDPLLARVAGSESYFAACASLLFGATAVLAATARRLRVRSPVFLLGAAAAGLFIAQAARVHAYSWFPAAAIPLVVLLGAGRLSRRVRAAAAAAAVIAAVVAVAALPAMLSVISGSLGARWTPRAESVMSVRGLPVWLAGAALAGAAGVVAYRRAAHAGRVRALTVASLVAIAWAAGPLTLVLLPIAALSLWMRPGRGFVRAWTLALLVLLARLTKLQLAQVPLWIDSAYATLYLPMVLAAVVALVARAPAGRARRVVAAAIAVGGCVATVALWTPFTTLATDVIEEMRVASWPARLPPGATVAYLGWVGDRVQDLPRNFPGQEPIRMEALDGRAGDVDLGAPREGLYYYRSSLCTSTEGRALCDAVERRYALEPVEAADLPARPSMYNLGYDRSVVSVALYRVAGRKE